ncbi:MAG TPA: DDE-type integrase/transposase/recombinase [Polyangiaceae bacterium]
MVTPDSHSVPLPKDWPAHVRSAFVCAVGLAHAAITVVRGWAVNSRIARVRLAGDNDRLKAEVALLNRELDLLRARFERIPAKNRPHLSPAQRLEVLQLKAARAWNSAQIARRFLLAPSTVAAWLKRLEDDGVGALVRVPPPPIHRFPDFVARLVQDLSGLLPTMGKKRIAQLLARAGVHLSTSTVRRLQQRPWVTPPAPEPAGSDSPAPAARQPVAATAPHHTWHVDTTVVPISTGLWAPWFPFALPNFWPFSWHVAVVVDHFSRKLLGFQVFAKEPSATQMLEFLDTTIAAAGASPKYIITDRGTQFGSDYLLWCEARGIRARFGALGHKRAIAIVERFIRSMKDEGLRRILVPMRLELMRTELVAYAAWYNTARPHQALGGRTPEEVCFGRKPARDGPRFEPRPGLAAHLEAHDLRPEHGAALELVVDFQHGRPHLPLPNLKAAA